MRNLLSLRKVCLITLIIIALPACTRDDDNVSRDYVDLGLSSGTKWKVVNERSVHANGFYNFNEALDFGNNLPSMGQWLELANECSWTWTGIGYKVVGPNGKSISLPANGHSNCFGTVGLVEIEGAYWSSTRCGAEEAIFFFFSKGGRCTDHDRRCAGYSVRLVQK